MEKYYDNMPLFDGNQVSHWHCLMGAKIIILSWQPKVMSIIRTSHNNWNKMSIELEFSTISWHSKISTIEWWLKISLSLDGNQKWYYLLDLNLGLVTKFAKTRKTSKGWGHNIPWFTFKCVKSAREDDRHFQMHSHFQTSKLVRSHEVFWIFGWRFEGPKFVQIKLFKKILKRTSIK